MASAFRRKGRKKHTVKFRDKGGVWRETLGYIDKRASEEMGRKLERLANLRAAGEAPSPELTRFVRGLPVKL